MVVFGDDKGQRRASVWTWVVKKQQSIGVVIWLVVPWYGPEVEDLRMLKELRSMLSRDPRIVVIQ